MPLSFAELTQKDAAGWVASGIEDWFAVNQAFYDGDHWQEGSAWIGPYPKANTEGWHEIVVALEASLVALNLVEEVVDRKVDGVIGQEPSWRFTPRAPRPMSQPADEDAEEPDAAQAALIAEVEAALVEWWDERGVLEVMQKAEEIFNLKGKVVLRLFVPEGELDEDGRIPRGSLTESIMRVYVEALDPEVAAVITDRRTMRKVGIFIYTDEDDEGEAEANAELTNQRAEVCYTEGTATVIRILAEGAVTEENPQGIVSEVRENIGRRMLMHQIEGKELITEQVRTLQKATNLALTMGGKNIVAGGFLERVITNASVPGRWVTDTTQPEGRRWESNPVKLGPATIAYLEGLRTRNADGTTSIAQVGVHYKEPSSVAAFVETVNMNTAALLRSVKQLHALLSGDAAASGESRRQALADFLSSLRRSATRQNRAGRWLLETVAALGATFSGQPGRYDQLRCDYAVRLNPGPITADEQRLAGELHEKKIIPLEEAMIRVGIDDPDAAKAKLDQEREAAIAAGFFAGNPEDLGNEDFSDNENEDLEAETENA